jgi:hypothetical protein
MAGLFFTSQSQLVGDPDVLAFLAATGITDATITAAITQLVADLKSYSLWSSMVALYPIVGGTATTHKYNLKNPVDSDAAFRLSFIGGWTHAATGATPNGTNGYADTHCVLSANTTQNSQALGYYSRTNILNESIDMGCRDATYFSYVLFRWYYPVSIGSINGNTDIAIHEIYDTACFLINSRTGAANFISQMDTTQTTITQTSTGISTKSMYIGAFNNNGIAVAFTPRETAFNFISTGLNSTQLTNMYTIVQAFQTALGREV